LQNHTRRIMCLLGAILLAVMLTACGSAEPAPTSTPTPTIPGGIDGTVEGQTYKNGAAGFELTFPEGYTLLDKAQAMELLANNSEEAKDYFQNPELVEQAAQNSQQKAAAFKYPLDYAGFNPNINIIIVQGNGEDPNDIVDIANEIVKQGNQAAVGMTYGSVEAAQIGGRPAAAAGLTIEGMDVLEKQYYMFNNNYMLIITLAAFNESELDELEQILDTFKFY
jgi:hypothetical protein